jgi:hypothetical protein
MQSNNQKCNAFQCVIGIFLHSCNTPERVIQLLAHMGISISIDAIHDAIRSLSKETYDELREAGQQLLVAYAYDNFDINFKTLVPTVERPGDILTHLTSGCLIFLEHGVSLSDLNCSDKLWASSSLNPSINCKTLPTFSCANLETLHAEPDHATGLTRRERFNAWKFLSDLLEFGPVPLHRLKSKLSPPEVVEKIPVTKMRYLPARSMDINQSTVSGNIKAIKSLLEQGGVGDPSEGMDPNSIWERDITELDNHVVLIHGDLGTGERVQSILERRSLESTPFRRFQFVIFVMGLFHLKMACADALWRIFIEPKAGREDLNSLMHFAALLRPRQTGKIGSDPGFRIMHELIMHCGTALRLDAWRLEAKRRNPLWVTLEDFAASNPSKELLDDMANTLAMNFVAGGDIDMWEIRRKPSASRDKQHENILLMHQYFLLYEELSYAMNLGDIGRVETLFPPWIYLFKATGKHKYAKHMIKFLTDVHFVYPEGLRCVKTTSWTPTLTIRFQFRHAIRYNILVNPTGQERKFRGVDWVEETWINLYTKVLFSHTRTCQRIC